MIRETPFVDSYGKRLTIDQDHNGGFEVCSNGNRRRFAADLAPNVALAVLNAAGWEWTSAAQALRDVINTIKHPSPHVTFPVETVDAAAGQIKTLPDCIVPAATFMVADDLGLDRVVGATTINHPNPNAVSTLEYVHAVLADVTLGDDKTVVDANVVDPDAVAAKALESLNDAWGGDEPYPAPILKAILALEEHAETLMADAEQAELEREALDLRSIVFGNTATEWADLTREAKAKWIAVALRAREFRSKDAQ